MTIPDTPHYLGLKHFHDPKNLAFRAACTAAAPPLFQPITGRVIKRMHDSDDARIILVRLWDAMLANGEALAAGDAVSDYHLAAALTEDLCWKTLVQEEVTAIWSMYRHNNAEHWERAGHRRTE